MDYMMSWQESLGSLSLGPDDVHVWSAEVMPLGLAEHAVLSADERDHTERFRREADRARFAFAHVLLRDVLSRYLSVAPADLSFAVGEYGKPALSRTHHAEWLRFNLTHSRDVVLCAVARGRELGVDVEGVWPDQSYERIAEQFFSPRELARLRQLPATQRPDAFFTCWTLKEAYLKARGEGLSVPLNSFDVSFGPGAVPGLRRVAGQPGETARWSFVSFRPAPGYAAALAVEGRDWSLSGYRWSWQSTAALVGARR
ncbi:MAG: 4'-phosphopantetheinyl transferase family protein [Anaerolineae bacterium]